MCIRDRSKGLTQSALAEVTKIHRRAAQEKNDPQLIKALLYEMNLHEAISENAEIENITSIEKEINGAREPARSMLQSIAAERYWNYLQQNRWQLYNRTPTTASPGNDITSWGVEDFHRKI